MSRKVTPKTLAEHAIYRQESALKFSEATKAIQESAVNSRAGLTQYSEDKQRQLAKIENLSILPIIQQNQDEFNHDSERLKDDTHYIGILDRIKRRRQALDIPVEVQSIEALSLGNTKGMDAQVPTFVSLTDAYSHYKKQQQEQDEYSVIINQLKSTGLAPNDILTLFQQQSHTAQQQQTTLNKSEPTTAQKRKSDQLEEESQESTNGLESSYNMSFNGMTIVPATPKKTNDKTFTAVRIGEKTTTQKEIAPSKSKTTAFSTPSAASKTSSVSIPQNGVRFANTIEAASPDFSAKPPKKVPTTIKTPNALNPTSKPQSLLSINSSTPRKTTQVLTPTAQKGRALGSGGSTMKVSAASLITKERPQIMKQGIRYSNELESDCDGAHFQDCEEIQTPIVPIAESKSAHAAQKNAALALVLNIESTQKEMEKRIRESIAKEVKTKGDKTLSQFIHDDFEKEFENSSECDAHDDDMLSIDDDGDKSDSTYQESELLDSDSDSDSESDEDRRSVKRTPTNKKVPVAKKAASIKSPAKTKKTGKHVPTRKGQKSKAALNTSDMSDCNDDDDGGDNAIDLDGIMNPLDTSFNLSTKLQFQQHQNEVLQNSTKHFHELAGSRHSPTTNQVLALSGQPSINPTLQGFLKKNAAQSSSAALLSSPPSIAFGKKTNTNQVSTPQHAHGKKLPGVAADSTTKHAGAAMSVKKGKITQLSINPQQVQREQEVLLQRQMELESQLSEERKKHNVLRHEISSGRTTAQKCEFNEATRNKILRAQATTRAVCAQTPRVIKNNVRVVDEPLNDNMDHEQCVNANDIPDWAKNIKEIAQQQRIQAMVDADQIFLQPRSNWCNLEIIFAPQIQHYSHSHGNGATSARRNNRPRGSSARWDSHALSDKEIRDTNKQLGIFTDNY